eukprot:jgi/Botrbrau1/13777/Bobra.0056s0030.2
MYNQRRKQLNPSSLKEKREAGIIPEEVNSNSTAADLRLRERKRQEELKAAAVAAAKAAPPNILTYFPDDPKKAKVSDLAKGSPNAMDLAAGTTSKQMTPDGRGDQPRSSSSTGVGRLALSHSCTDDEELEQNPLASLLAYGADDAGDSDEEESPRQDKEHVPVDDGVKQTEGSLPDEENDPLDNELHNFMSELQASGLLKDDASDIEESQEFAPSSAEADEAEISAAASALTVAEQVDDMQEESTGHAAEQRVLGDLQGCPGWSEVMDMSSGKVYFWNIETNEVAWDPPEGSVPRSDEENAATLAQSRGESTKAGSPEDQNQSGDLHAGAAGEAENGTEEAAEELDIDDNDNAPETQKQDGNALLQKEDVPHPDEIEIAVPLPAESIGPSYAALVQLTWQHAEAACGGSIPAIVRLAVEAEVRWRDWQMLSDVQFAAAASKNLDATLSWPSYESYMRESLEALQNASVSELAAAEAEFNVSESPSIRGSSHAAEDNKLETASSEELEEGEVPAPTADEGVDMDIEREESAPPLPREEDMVYSPTNAQPVDEEPPPIPDEAPPLPEEDLPAEDRGEQSILPPLPSEPDLPSEAHLPEENGAPLLLPEAAQLMLTALAGRAISPVPTSSAPPVKRKEYRAEPVYVAPVFSPEPVQPEPPIAHVETKPPADAVRGKKRDRSLVAASAVTKKRVKLAKGASSLINKWQQVRKNLEEEDQKEEEILDAEALELKRAREVEEWRLQQLRAGTTAEANANFQVLLVKSSMQ